MEEEEAERAEFVKFWFGFILFRRRAGATLHRWGYKMISTFHVAQVAVARRER